ncbi:hypothetical protein [Vibrio sp. CAU 1672]|uniref:hypothetical protein n=1 Tax=Vibrio sp. CAU 1672 TaxID=3032594 RepID=UPI0023DAFE49|nr:hypothetical protein [Vibrio sp. CAU 1672]MDF2153435.1 hypothetical protein [Vibrio sp. CAU 1672]
MQKRIALCVSTLSTTLLAGCATPTLIPNILSVDPNNLSEQQAILIVSTAADETCTSFSSAIVIKESNQPPTLLSSIGTMQLNNSFVKSDFKGEYAKVYSTIIKPGEYDFWLQSQNPYFEFTDPLLTSSFTLEPGEIKYVGEIHSDGCNSLTITANNKSERDINFLKSLQPKLDTKAVSIEPLKIIMK